VPTCDSGPGVTKGGCTVKLGSSGLSFVKMKDKRRGPPRDTLLYTLTLLHNKFVHSCFDVKGEYT
jgi:hypothetical protein